MDQQPSESKYETMRQLTSEEPMEDVGFIATHKPFNVKDSLESIKKGCFKREEEVLTIVETFKKRSPNEEWPYLAYFVDLSGNFKRGAESISEQKVETVVQVFENNPHLLTAEMLQMELILGDIASSLEKIQPTNKNVEEAINILAGQAMKFHRQGLELTKIWESLTTGYLLIP